MLVYALVVARLESNLFDCLAQKIRNTQLFIQSLPIEPGLLPRDFDSQADFSRIVSSNLSANAILQWTDYFSAGRVIFRVVGTDEHHIQRQANGITLNLHIAFLHDV